MLKSAGKQYGQNIIRDYSNKLIIEVGKRYTERNLRYMRQFYEMIDTIKWNTACSKLSWSHYREVISLKSNREIIYYLSQAEIKMLSQRQLHEMIKLKMYNRISSVEDKTYELIDSIPNPIILKSDINNNKISEKLLQKIILEDISSFLNELGDGYAFIQNEYKIKIGNKYNYIDLLLYNIKYNAYVVIELKVTELKKEHIGQIEVYMNYIDENVKTNNQENTIGIIICKKNNKYIIGYSSDKRIMSKEYLIIN